MAGVNSKVFQIPDDNLESFSIFWLDAKVNTTDENRQTQQKLRQIINHLKTFDDQDQCRHHILSLSPQDRLILIISGRCGQELVPHIHPLRQLSSIYVYCMDKEANEKWTKDFTKVKGVIVQLEDLINQIKQDQKSRMKIEEPLSINIFSVSDNPDQSTTRLNRHFIHSILLIDVLIRMRLIKADKQQLVTLCKNEYQKNEMQLALVSDFEREYSADKAIWWYTRDSFLYKILNKALRVQNFDLFFLFRFVVGDIYQQLKQNQCASLVHVYRGQVMSNDELNTLRRSVGDFVSINSFFSTTLDRQKTMGFLNKCDISSDFHRVLFDIDADPRIVTAKPFADISSLSNFGNEREVLFMIGCIFRLIDIRRDNDEQIWIIKMKLCGDDEYGLKKLFDHMKEEYGGGDNEVNLCSFGNVLRQMGKYDIAEKMYLRLLDEQPSNDPSLCHLYYSLGVVNKDKGEYDASLQWFDKSLKIKMQTDPSDYVFISGTYTWMGGVHWKKGDKKLALEYSNKAITLFQQAKDDNHLSVAYLYHNIAFIYHQEKKYSETLEYYKKSLDIKEKHLPSDHPSVAVSYNNIGVTHLNLGQHDLAMQNYNQSLKIRLKSLPSQHHDIGMSYENIGVVYEKKKEWKQALINYEKAATIYRHSLPVQHPDVIEIEKKIKDVSSKQN